MDAWSRTAHSLLSAGASSAAGSTMIRRAARPTLPATWTPRCRVISGSKLLPGSSWHQVATAARVKIFGFSVRVFTTFFLWRELFGWVRTRWAFASGTALSLQSQSQSHTNRVATSEVKCISMNERPLALFTLWLCVTLTRTQR